MKKCPVCGLDLDESYLFCPEDGSALAGPQAAQPEHAVAQEMAEEKAGSVVLYCPACAAEYPLTFSSCPVHAVPLTKHKIPTFVSPPRKPVAAESVPPVAQPPTARDEIIESEKQSQEAAPSPSPENETAQPSMQPSIARPRRRFRFRAKEKASAYTLIGLAEPPVSTEREAEQFDDSSDDKELDVAPVESVRDQRSFRNAAYAVAVFLLAFGLLGLTSLYRSLAKRPVPSASRTANQSSPAADQPVAVYTPQAALDYKEEKPEPEKQEIEPQVEAPRADRESPRGAVNAVPVAQSKRSDRPEQEPVLTSRQPPPAPAPTPVSVTRPAPASELVLPRGTFGQVDARLVNVRSRKTQNGVRYDLTFNMQDQAGQPTQWERLAIQTRSASGVSRSQMMPFYHRLGAAGTLTFTVSVEMQGRAQPDWQGRIICTSIGTDPTGRSHRASFGANVSPN
ncbi:MAG TPA: hypothetical protein VJZ26_06330 [Blastocatellia bacterium]|nr:hypothetical protein [Blastocatellia bacterium]